MICTIEKIQSSNHSLTLGILALPNPKSFNYEDHETARSYPKEIKFFDFFLEIERPAKGVNDFEFSLGHF
jgi:hypothetical protein